MKVLNAQGTCESGLSLQQYSTLPPAGEVSGRVDGVGVSDLGRVLLFFVMQALEKPIQSLVNSKNGESPLICTLSGFYLTYVEVNMVPKGKLGTSVPLCLEQLEIVAEIFPLFLSMPHFKLSMTKGKSPMLTGHRQ